MSQNPYQSTQPRSWTTVEQSSVDERSRFIRNTYLHLAGALLAFAAIEFLAINLFDEQIGQLTQMVTGGLDLALFSLAG